jgi:hypothetical protein
VGIFGIGCCSSDRYTFLQSFLVIGSDEGQNDTTGLSGLVTEAMDLSNSNPQKAKELVFELLGQKEVVNNTLMLSRLYSAMGYSYINIGQNDSAMIFARLSSDL